MISKRLQYGWTLALALFVSSGVQAKEYIVKFKDTKSLSTAVSAKSLEQGLITSTHEKGRLLTVDFGKSSIREEAQKVAALLARKDIEYVVENVKMHAFGIPDDPQFDSQWSLAKVRASEAWDTTVGSKEVIVAVIDTGINWDHPDLRDQIWINEDEIANNGVDDDGNGYIDDVRGWDFRDGDNNPDDLTGAQNPGHGTHCAGIVGASGNNGVGISGMAQQVSLMAVRFLGADGSGDLMNGAKAIDYAVENGAHIISASWGASIPESGAGPIIEAIGRANDAGVIFVAAAANDGANNDSRGVFPANTNLPNVISVAASNPEDGKPSWSNFGKSKVHVSAPGEGILSTLPGDKYENLSGTSMATPLVSGLVALLKSQNPDLTGAEAKAILQTTGAEVAIETACDCRVDAKAALDALGENRLTPVPAAKTFAPGETSAVTAFGGAGGYTFSSENPEIVAITEQGNVEAKAIGETRISVTDSAGASVQSLFFRVAEAVQGEECPFPDPLMCQLMCVISPELPWCL